MSEDSPIIQGLDSTIIQGLDEEFHNIDISEVEGTAVSAESTDFLLVPTQPLSSETTPALLDTGSLGFIDSPDSTGSTPGHSKPHGKAATYLQGKGFGWLLEVEEEEEDAKPLL